MAPINITRFLPDTHLLRSSSFRLAALYAGMFGASVLILLAFIYWSTAGYLARQTDATIESEIKGLAEQYRQRGVSGVAAVLRERIANDKDGVTVYLLTSPDLSRLVGNLNRWPSQQPDTQGWVEFQLSYRADENRRPRLARARVFRLRGGLRLLVGRNIRELEETKALLVSALSWGLGVMLLLGLVGGGLMSWSMLRRIESINQTSREIMTGDLSRRIPTKGTGDDFDQLADSLNIMLDRIQMLMEGIRQVSDNIAHDLRTPLTRLRGRLEHLRDGSEMGAGERAGEGRALLEDAVGDADALLATFSALLRIAEIESGGRRAGFKLVVLDELVNDVAEFYEPLAQEKGQQFNVMAEDGLTLHGDRDLLFQALANALDNAVKYTPADGVVSIALVRCPGGAEITVSDSGPGIPADDHDRVFGRFFRLEPDRGSPGNGLGLSLVRAVAGLHDAEIRLDDNEPGLRMVLTLPLTESAPGPE